MNILTNTNKNDILLDDKRGTDFLLPKNRVQSRLEKLNRFSLVAEMHPFLLEENMCDKLGRFIKGNQGHLGYKHSLETKIKLSKIQTNRPSPKKGKKYHPLSKEHKQKISEGVKEHLPKTAFKNGNIPYIRTVEHREKMRLIQTGKRKGEKNYNWQGGKRCSNGYVYVYSPNHPFCNKANIVAEHRLVMEKILGRYLESQEIVHHQNGIKNDNRPENLMLFKNNAEHKKFFHYGKAIIKILCPICKNIIELSFPRTDSEKVFMRFKCKDAVYQYVGEQKQLVIPI